MQSENPKVAKIYQYNLFGNIPLLKIKQRYNVKRYLLFGFLPVLKNKYVGNDVEMYLFSVIPFMVRNKIHHIDYKELVPGFYYFSGILPFDAEGLQNPEGWGRWSDGDITSFFLQTDKEYIAEFNLHAFLSVEKPRQIVTLYINGYAKQKYIFEYGKEEPRIIVNLPKAKRLHIVFKYEDVKSPADLGLSEDNRKIAVGFQTVEIRG